MNIVAVPVHNEAGHIADLLDALAEQAYSPPFEVLLFLNNCIDQTREVVEAIAPTLPFHVHIEESDLPPQNANAGTARHLATKLALARTKPEDVILTTDADAMPQPGWMVANFAALARGADAVAGMAIIDPIDEAKLPMRLVADEAKVERLTLLLDRIENILDPLSYDPWPRHAQHSGASIAVTAATFARVGGIPAIASGEDRAFFTALRRHDARIRHAPDAAVVVSGRLIGRAEGGMADTMRRRIVQADTFLDDAVERVDRRLFRARIRQTFRQAWNKGDVLEFCNRHALPASITTGCRAAPRFGEAWHLLGQCWPSLEHVRVPATDVELEIKLAEAALRVLEPREAAAA